MLSPNRLPTTEYRVTKLQSYFGPREIDDGISPDNGLFFMVGELDRAKDQLHLWENKYLEVSIFCPE